ncbi:unnamed protein product [Victoria cruziana]
MLYALKICWKWGEESSLFLKIAKLQMNFVGVPQTPELPCRGTRTGTIWRGRSRGLPVCFIGNETVIVFSPRYFVGPLL